MGKTMGQKTAQHRPKKDVCDVAAGRSKGMVQRTTQEKGDSNGFNWE